MATLNSILEPEQLISCFKVERLYKVLPVIVGDAQLVRAHEVSL